MVLLFLCMISIVEVFSASSTLTYKSQNYLGPIIGHSWKILVGVGTAILILNIPCRFFKLMTPALLLISGIMLFWVLFFGEKTNDAGRWISLFGLKFQPSEIAKGTMVLVTAARRRCRQTGFQVHPHHCVAHRPAHRIREPLYGCTHSRCHFSYDVHRSSPFNAIRKTHGGWSGICHSDGRNDLPARQLRE